jgi:hypothetical protein
MIASPLEPAGAAGDPAFTARRKLLVLICEAPRT